MATIINNIFVTTQPIVCHKNNMSVYKHEQYAFYGCTELCEVTLPHSLDTGNYLSQAFYNCPKMKHLYIKKNADRSGHLFESENGGLYYGSYYADRLIKRGSLALRSA